MKIISKHVKSFKKHFDYADVPPFSKPLYITPPSSHSYQRKPGSQEASISACKHYSPPTSYPHVSQPLEALSQYMPYMPYMPYVPKH